MKSGVIAWFFIQVAVHVSVGKGTTSIPRNKTFTEKMQTSLFKHLPLTTTPEVSDPVTEYSAVQSEPTSQSYTPKTLFLFSTKYPQSSVIPEESLSQSTTGDSIIHSSVTALYTEQDLLRELLQNPPRNSFDGLSSSCSVDPSLRLCGCTSVCTELQNCCYDSEFQTENLRNNSEIGHKAYSCYENFERKWTLSSPSRLIDKCLPSWEDPVTHELCETPNPEDVHSYIPCYSEESGFVYRNIYCLKCNHFQECLQWQLSYLCAAPVGFSSIDTFDKMYLRAGNYRQSYRREEFHLAGYDHHEPVHCIPSSIMTCVEAFASGHLKNLCRAYYSPVLISGAFYRNIHCFQCSTGREPDSIELSRSRQKTNAIRILLNPQGPNQSKGDNCEGGQCTPRITKIRGFAQEVNVYARYKCSTIELEQMTVNSFKQSFIKVAWQILRLNIITRLAGLNVTIRDSKSRGREYNNTFVISAVVIITHEIGFGEIPGIQKTIRSVGFDVKVLNTCSISCCYDENDLSLGLRHQQEAPQTPRNSTQFLVSSEQQRSQTCTISLSCLFTLLLYIFG